MNGCVAMGKTLIDKFNKLEIRGARLEELFVAPLKVLRITLSMYPNYPNSSYGVRTYQIQFNKIVNFHLSMKVTGSHVISHNAYDKSSMLDDFKRKPVVFSRNVELTNLSHFDIVFDEAKLTVLSEGCSINVIWEV